MMAGRVRFSCLLLLLVGLCSAYIPGIAPKDYGEGAQLEVYANKLQAPKGNVPHPYHYAYPFCRPESLMSSQKSEKLNLGQMLMGERHEFTNFEINMLEDTSCKFLCQGEVGKNMTGPLQKLNSDLIHKLMQRLIDDKYVVRLNLDNLPVVMHWVNSQAKEVFNIGYPFGVKQNETYYVHNHFRFRILYHEPKQLPKELRDTDMKVYRVVGFEVQPFSIKENKKGSCLGEDLSATGPMQPLDVEPITFTYDVIFEQSDQSWATRWDPLLATGQEEKEIQWMSIFSSIMLTVSLTLIVGAILLKTVHNDFVRYSKLEDEAEILNEHGWKLVHADVFRCPKQPELLAVINGIGAQLLWTLFGTLLLALCGFFSPAYRGGLLTGLLSLWVLLSSISGYVSARLYSMFGGQNRRLVSYGSAFLFSGCVFGLFILLNMLLSLKQSTASVPFVTLLLIGFGWFGLSVPLVLVGAYIGYRGKTYEWPSRTNQVPREIPKSFVNKTSPYHCLVTGLVPFGVVFFQLIFVLNKLWQNQLYYTFGFLFIVFLLVVIASAEVSISFTYLKLTSEDYRWWWYSYRNTSTTGVYVFMYCIFFFFGHSQLDVTNHLSSMTLFLAYTSIVSVSFGMIVGYIGMMASMWFVSKIYSSIRID